MDATLSIPFGALLRIAVSTLLEDDDRLSGAVLGVWNGLLIHQGWLKDGQLTPSMLAQLVVGLAFDLAVFSSANVVRAMSMLLGLGLGLLLSDIVPAVWYEINGRHILRDVSSDASALINSLPGFNIAALADSASDASSVSTVATRIVSRSRRRQKSRPPRITIDKGTPRSQMKVPEAGEGEEEMYLTPSPLESTQSKHRPPSTLMRRMLDQGQAESPVEPDASGEQARDAEAAPRAESTGLPRSPLLATPTKFQASPPPIYMPTSPTGVFHAAMSEGPDLPVDSAGMEQNAQLDDARRLLSVSPPLSDVIEVPVDGSFQRSFAPGTRIESPPWGVFGLPTTDPPLRPPSSLHSRDQSIQGQEPVREPQFIPFGELAAQTLERTLSGASRFASFVTSLRPQPDNPSVSPPVADDLRRGWNPGGKLREGSPLTVRALSPPDGGSPIRSFVPLEEFARPPSGQSDDRLEGPSFPPPEHSSRGHEHDYVSEATAPESILSGGPKAVMLARAELLRNQAAAALAKRKQLVHRREEAQRQSRWAEAFALKCQIEEADELARRLNRRAERRYYNAHNLSNGNGTIDVHGLKLQEAIRQTEAALRQVQLKGGRRLRVIVGRGKHSKGGFPVLKAGLQKHMAKQNLSVVVERSNPGVLHINL